jgi:putative membrane protein
VDNNEIAAANLAIQKSSNPAVKDYANMMLKEHNDNLQNVTAIAKDLNVQIQDDKNTLALKDKGLKELNTLDGLKDVTFDKAYIKAMVDGHAKVLKAIDKLSKKATNPKVKAFLADTRTHVVKHLDAAKKVEGGLK